MKTTTDVLMRRKLWAIDGANAWVEYLAAPNVVAAKTARLKQERLMHERLACEAELMVKPQKKASRKEA